VTGGMQTRAFDASFLDATDDHLRDQIWFQEISIRLAKNKPLVLVVCTEEAFMFLLLNPKEFERRQRCLG
jgi:hypothetical protein